MKINKINKVKTLVSTLFATIFVSANSLVVKAAGTSVITNEDASNLGNNIKSAVEAIAMPLGSALVFASVVMAAIRIIVNHYNPNKRGEALGSIGWIAIGAIILGGALMISGVIMSIGTSKAA